MVRLKSRHRWNRRCSALTARSSPWRRASGLIVWDGRPAVQTVLRDVTGRKNTERELRESERRYRTLVEQSPDAIVINQDAEIVFANRASLRLFGAASEDDLVGLAAEEVVHPDLRQRAHERVGRLLKLGGILPLAEIRMLRLDGEPLDVETTGTSITWGGGAKPFS